MTKTAAETLATNLKDARLAISMLMDSLNELEQEAATDPKNWGYAGTAGHLANLAVEALADSKGCEPADAREVMADVLA